MVRKPEVLSKFNLRDGGRGEVVFHYIMSAEEMMGHGPMFAKLVLKPGSKIGYHQHVGETEPYYILSGEGVFTDNDGSVTVVKPGDVCYIECNHSHSIENVSESVDLELMALIIKEQ